MDFRLKRAMRMRAVLATIAVLGATGALAQAPTRSAPLERQAPPGDQIVERPRGGAPVAQPDGGNLELAPLFRVPDGLQQPQLRVVDALEDLAAVIGGHIRR